MQIIDLSLTIEPNESEPVPIEIKYISHEEGAELLGKPIGLTRNDFPDKIGLSIEHIFLTTHTGTHIDAPLHYGPFSEGNISKNVSDLPLNWFFSDAVLLRLEDDPLLGDVMPNEIQAKLIDIGYKIKPYDIVLIQTNGDQFWRKPEYFTHFRGMSAEATEWLIDQGVKVIGVDTFGFDAPFGKMLENYKDTGNKKFLWPAHILGRKREYCQIERLTNLKSIPIEHGFKVICFPIKVARCGAGWSRAVAQVP